LFVEENPALCRQMRGALEKEGFKVLMARNSIEALVIAADYPLAIDVLVAAADTRACHNGVELASCFRILRPETRIILTSKKSAGVPSAVTEFEGEIQYLAAPYATGMLIDAVARPTRVSWKSAQTV
jgi:DNA-binding NtrC family response regulator